ncbi:MAG: hypothetical protein ABEK00_01840 [Candidatus Nanohaloarchaea archaeon]
MEDVKYFSSRLGEVAVTESHVERKRDSEDWENIKENFPEEKLVDRASFNDIDQIKLEENSVYPNVKLKIDGEWKRLFMHVGDNISNLYKTLNYRWKTYRQLYQN